MNPTTPSPSPRTRRAFLSQSAAREGTEVTWDDMMRRNERLEFPAHRLRARPPAQESEPTLKPGTWTGPR